MKTPDPLFYYLASLTRAEVQITGNVDDPVAFNGFTCPVDYAVRLMHAEYAAAGRLLDFFKVGVDTRRVVTMVHEKIFDLDRLFRVCGGNLDHRYLRITRAGRHVTIEQLGPECRKRLNEFLFIQRDSFARQRAWFTRRYPVMSSPYTLLLSEVEIGEMMAFFYHTGLLGDFGRKLGEREFIHFFCRAWNLSLDHDYKKLMSDALNRPQPITLLYRILEDLTAFIEGRDVLKK